MTSSKQEYSVWLTLWVALSITLGLIVGLPMIYRKDGMGLVAILFIPVLTIVTISLVAKRGHPSLAPDPPKTKPRSHARPLWALVLCIIAGSSIAAVGGIVTHYASPMHPLDLWPNLIALGVLGAFAGFVVGTTLLFASFFAHR